MALFFATILRRGTSFIFFEYSVKIWDISKTDMITYFRYGYIFLF